MKKTMIPVAGGILFLVLLMTGMWIYYDKSIQKIEQKGWNAAVYEKHYVMISGSDDYLLWKSVYEDARDIAAQENVNLEWIDEASFFDYTSEDCMEIAMASKVDGIILNPDGSPAMTNLIAKAAQEKIPVVTVLNDDSKSERVSFVGLNSYQMGNIYGNQVLKLLHDGTNQILLLLNSSADEINTNLMYAQINSLLEENKTDGQSVLIETKYVDSSTNFDTEEAIRDIFVNSEEMPDILICMDAVSTESAYQAIVDYNQVGNVNIIGYYDSDTVLDAIQKDLIPVTISVNTKEVAQFSINALNEYLSLGYVSNYFNVGIEIVTAENVEKYIEENETE